ncbi:DNA-binding transcriptional regulator YhcF, GntR family [Sporobacter termitidis DSM 10068]|uniref:DNA-binding transcriptional regulator YhcF, GntR family n=1 Tax=Sporobacter termitidis DSM 10068 TaxID=1123282 RepID=A0A1M5VSN0_9FIRM|nr:GntR family transcriptional regulator [Sporobacter termitidis]SHH78188.1 DNA-binding transcriptional regulator YhcF, GntR family [Sporobacter termitidis DSM 10068]
MNWTFDTDRPIYLQLKEQILLLIVSGSYPAGSKLPAVRDMAAEAAVNPNTLQKALSELERDGLVYTQRTSGRFVTEDDNMIQQAKKDLAYEQIELFLKKMAGLGYTKEETLALINNLVKE